jgi:hypothetical protein
VPLLLATATFEFPEDLVGQSAAVRAGLIEYAPGTAAGLRAPLTFDP